jgi:hypothetical protein
MLMSREKMVSPKDSIDALPKMLEKVEHKMLSAYPMSHRRRKAKFTFAQQRFRQNADRVSQ